LALEIRVRDQADIRSHLTQIVTFEMPGSVVWCAGRLVELDSSWGRKFAGNYIIDRVLHRIDSNGHACSVTMHKCLKGY
jgi:hypothetical protein